VRPSSRLQKSTKTLLIRESINHQYQLGVTGNPRAATESCARRAAADSYRARPPLPDEASAPIMHYKRTIADICVACLCRARYGQGRELQDGGGATPRSDLRQKARE
jgi:hypothetical protein